AGDELSRHPGNVAAQNKGSQPREDTGRAQACLEHGDEAVHPAKIFAQMGNDIARAPEGGEDVDEAKHLHLEGLVAHREGHHLLVKAGLGENRFRVLIDQTKYLLAATFHDSLQGTHGARIKRGARFGKARALRTDRSAETAGATSA